MCPPIRGHLAQQTLNIEQALSQRLLFSLSDLRLLENCSFYKVNLFVESPLIQGWHVFENFSVCESLNFLLAILNVQHNLQFTKITHRLSFYCLFNSANVVNVVIFPWTSSSFNSWAKVWNKYTPDDFFFLIFRMKTEIYSF